MGAVDGVDSGKDEFYLALMWSGAWSMTASRTASALSLAAGLAPMITTVRGAIDGPHVMFGAVTGGATAGTEALRAYIVNGLRAGRALSPLVTYNTWFAYGTERRRSVDDRGNGRAPRRSASSCSCSTPAGMQARAPADRSTSMPASATGRPIRRGSRTACGRCATTRTRSA